MRLAVPFRAALRGLALLLPLIGPVGCGYNALQTEDENVKTALAEVVTQYQRRADLIPDLVAAVQGPVGEAGPVVAELNAARAKLVEIPITPQLVNEPDTLQRFQAAQAELTSALKSLLTAAEHSPQLRADGNFRELQTELEQVQARIVTARDRYLEAVRIYDVSVRNFPTSLTARVFEFQDHEFRDKK